MGALVDQIALDAVRITHLLAIAVGLGTMVFTDLTTLRRVERPVGADYLRLLDSAHSIMMPALVLAWISGLGLIWVRTGFDLSAFTPKLWTKLIVVSGLTATAFAIRRLVMPILQRADGRVLMELDLEEKLILGTCASLSMSGWGMALVLGASQVFKTADWSVLIGSMLLVYATALGLALRLAHALHARLMASASSARRIAAE